MRVILWLAVAAACALVCPAQENTGPALAEAVAPVYPDLAVLGRIAGSVIVAVHISKDGAVAGASIRDGDQMLRQASLEAARLWHFEPRSAASDLDLIFTYKLMPKGTPEADLGAIFRAPYTVEVRRINPGPVRHYARAGKPARDRRSD